MGQNFTWYQLMDKMIGEKRQRFSDVNVSPMGIPQAPKQKEEIIIQKVFDSCAFKAIMSFTMGLYVINRKKIINNAIEVNVSNIRWCNGWCFWSVHSRN